MQDRSSEMEIKKESERETGKERLYVFPCIDFSRTYPSSIILSLAQRVCHFPYAT